jgi:phycocyanobilin:ferredoxin oxidoreductase
MSMIWKKLIECQDKIIETFDYHADEIEEPGLANFNQPDNGWINRVWSNEFIRRAHIDVVDARESKGLWMMHVCIFPQLHNDAPIYGFDVIAGKNKMTGAFHDFSRSSDPKHPMIQGYYDSVDHFVPKKQRELPEWATNIFTEKMLAAGNVNDEAECTEIIRIALENLKTYMWEVKDYNHTADQTEVAKAQDYYCHNQQQNPHTPAVMKSLGLPEEDVEVFCRDMLFPKLA